MRPLSDVCSGQWGNECTLGVFRFCAELCTHCLIDATHVSSLDEKLHPVSLAVLDVFQSTQCVPSLQLLRNCSMSHVGLWPILTNTDPGIIVLCNDVQFFVDVLREANLVEQ
eukprot:scpid106198/ scgid26692/ 